MEILQKYLLHKWQYFCFEKKHVAGHKESHDHKFHHQPTRWEVHFLITHYYPVWHWFCLDLFAYRDQYQDLSWNYISNETKTKTLSWNEISNETNTKTGLDLKILSRPRPILGLDSPSLEFQDQDQESRWTLRGNWGKICLLKGGSRYYPKLS